MLTAPGEYDLGCGIFRMLFLCLLFCFNLGYVSVVTSIEKNHQSLENEIKVAYTLDFLK